MSLNDVLKLRQFNAQRLEEVNGEVLIFGELQNTDRACPECGKEALKPHQYYQRKVRHIPICNLPTYLVFERKDWICQCGKVFLERLDFQDLRSTYTQQYEEYLWQMGNRMSWNTLAKQEQLHWDVVERILKKGGLTENKRLMRRFCDLPTPG